METLTKVSEEEYLRLETTTFYKNEYHAGIIVPIEGVPIDHCSMMTNIVGQLGIYLKHKDFRIYISRMLVKIPAYERYVYPDVIVGYGKGTFNRKKDIDVLLNPAIIIEITSKNTNDYDRTEKLSCYITLESLQEYWLIDSEKIEIMSYKRTLNNDWIVRINKNINEKIIIGEAEIEIKELYANTVFDTENPHKPIRKSNKNLT